jgi:hypothetical protein
LVLFAGVDMTCPEYEKICPFKAIGEEKEESFSDQQPDFDSVAHLEQQALSNVAPNHFEHQQQNNTFDMYALHGITRPEVVCSLCGLTFQQHDTRKCDQNGWLETGRHYLELPSDWPMFDEFTKSWLNL